jgi:sigma-B regulation protein RsbU (phosphoserine phosphatase)
MFAKVMDPETLARRELKKLSKAQLRLLPDAAPAVPGYRLVLRYRPAYFAGGDYYDFFHRPDGRTGVFVGDGSGHGPGACMLMATMRAVLRTHPELHGEPGPTLTAAGAWFRDLVPSDAFMTGVYLLLGEGGRVGWAAAGHHPPLRLGPGGDVPETDLDGGEVPLGIHVDHRVEYATVEWQLAPGERLLVFTDGLYEAQNRDGEKFGRERLEECLREGRDRPLPAMVQGILGRVADHLEGADFEDDFTLVAVENLTR